MNKGIILMLVGLFAVLVYFLPRFRYIVFHPQKLFWAIYDGFQYFKCKKYNLCPCTGQLRAYTAHFGGGKTLSMVQHARSMYRRYNDKVVIINGVKKIQKVIIYSNVEIKDVMYVPLTSMSIIRDITELEEPADIHFCHLVYIDESSVLLNSRNFRNNFADPGLLSSLLTCRHFSISLYYSSQKFKLSDSLLRSVTQQVVDCKKFWRIVLLTFYNADSVEMADDILMVKPLYRQVYFCDNKLFNSYDTLATVEAMITDDSYETPQEILEKRGTIYNGFGQNDKILKKNKSFFHKRKVS